MTAPDLWCRALPAVAAAAALLALAGCAQPAKPVIGDPVYSGLTPHAQQLARTTVQEALETARSRTSLSWQIAAEGSKGEVTPLRTYKTTTGVYCRDYEEVIQTASEGSIRRQGTACRDGDGLWKSIRS